MWTIWGALKLTFHVGLTLCLVQELTSGKVRWLVWRGARWTAGLNFTNKVHILPKKFSLLLWKEHYNNFCLNFLICAIRTNSILMVEVDNNLFISDKDQIFSGQVDQVKFLCVMLKLFFLKNGRGNQTSSFYCWSRIR